MPPTSGGLRWEPYRCQKTRPKTVVAIPSFLTIVTIPLTFSIANGLSIGFTAYTVLKIARGEFRDVNWLVYLLTALFVVRFFYLGAG
jgi:AGZA family xanthine/uracil permease-like MFS transporter